jgi:hypothetical protein
MQFITICTAVGRLTATVCYTEYNYTDRNGILKGNIFVFCLYFIFN